MAFELPLYLQAGVYPARMDRFLIDEVFRQQNRVMRGLVVSQRGAGANFSVDVSLGACAIRGTGQADQGMYLCRSTSTANVTVPTTPAANRTDSVIARVYDPNAGGAAGDKWQIEVIAGGSAIPVDSLVLATLARTPGESAILTAAITDVAPRGQLFGRVVTTAPTGKGVPGDIVVQC